jgi:hypothetical protein
MYECELTITGPQEGIQRFRNKAEGESPPERAFGGLDFNPERSVLNFHSLKPVPERLLPLCTRLDAEQKNWLQSEWGCLGAAGARISCEEPSKLVYRFRTARIPGIAGTGVPNRLLRTMSQNNPTLEFVLQFENATTLEAGRVTLFRTKGHVNRYTVHVCPKCERTPLACICKVQEPQPVPESVVIPVASGKRKFTRLRNKVAGTR